MNVQPFVFPPDRFPSFAAEQPNDNSPFPAEEFGPPLSFDPNSAEYQRSQLQLQCPGYEFRPTSEEIRAKRMEVSYDFLRDVYLQSNKNAKIAGWDNLLWRYYNLARKLERDWRVGYIAKSEIRSPKGNTLNAFLEYRFNLEDSGMCFPLLNQSINRSIEEKLDNSVNQHLINQSINQSTDEWMSEWINELTDQSIDRLVITAVFHLDAVLF